MQDGDALSNVANTTNFSLLLEHLKNFWQEIDLKGQHTDNKGLIPFWDACGQFYEDKTKKRINQHFRIFEQIDQPEIINDIETPTVNEIMSQLDWNWLCTGIPSERFHGDLHFENILLEERDGYSFFKFTFLDWRQDFGGLLEYGDIYYDLAKLNHGIIISHEIIDKELFSHSISNDVVKFDFLRKNVSVELERMFEKFIIEEGYEYRKVQYLTYLIFLNIASLHHYPYGLLLFHLGKLGLWKLLQEDKAKENKQNEN